MQIEIRNEQIEDYRIVEELTREAFWNLHAPGADEHFIVNKIRSSDDFIKELDFVAIVDNQIVGNIIYTKSYILDNQNNKFETITFGPISVLPRYQFMGVGKKLIEHSSKIARNLGYKAIIIYGYPYNYIKRGFKNCKDFKITNPNGKYPTALLVLELYENSLKNISGKFFESQEYYNINENEMNEFEKTFPKKEKQKCYSQIEFDITSNSFLE